MTMKGLRLAVPILSLIYIHVYGNVLYEEKQVPQAKWLEAAHTKTVARSALECAIRCNKMFDLDKSCNSIIFNESSNTCTTAWYIRVPKVESGLRVAWSSSVQNNIRDPWFAIDRQTGDNFFSNHDFKDKYPWLAIDLLRPEIVRRVEIVNREGFEERTRDIEVRVGDEKPFTTDTRGNTLYTSNSVCGEYIGPATSGSDSVIECAASIAGRYVTLQRIQTSDQPAINFVEVIIESEPAAMETIRILERASPNESNDGQCPKEYPFSYQGGGRCCQNSLEDPTGIKKFGNGFLNFDSKACYGKSEQCKVVLQNDF